MTDKSWSQIGDEIEDMVRKALESRDFGKLSLLFVIGNRPYIRKLVCPRLELPRIASPHRKREPTHSVTL